MQNYDAETGSDSDIVLQEPQGSVTRSAVARVAGVFLGAGLVVMALVNVHVETARSNTTEVISAAQTNSWLYAGASATAQSASPQATSSLEPMENLHDGNVCGNDEEFLSGLCYMKCTILTSGTYPIRTTPFTCCESHPCLANQKISGTPLTPCTGFDVGGNINGEEGECPHTPGTCLVDEEMFLGTCYKKCSLLTEGTHPTRIAAGSCCTSTGLACLNPFNIKTDLMAYNVGGGAGDHNQATPAVAHAPLAFLTEATSGSTA